MKIMVLSPYLPHRRVGHGGGTAVRDLVGTLAARHRVLLAALVRPGEEDLLDDVRKLGADLLPLPFLDRGAAGIRRLSLWSGRALSAARSLASGYPWYVEKYWSPDLARLIRTAAANFEPDAVQVEYLQMSLYVRDLRRWRDRNRGARPRLVLNTHELGSVPRERRAERAEHTLTRAVAGFEAAAWRRLQVDASAWADNTLCVTRGDSDKLRRMGGRRVTTVPLGMDLAAIPADWSPDADDETYLFVGSFGHRPNVLAAEMLVDTIWPRVRRTRSAARLIIAGRGSRDFLTARGPASAWEAHGITALGFVDDLAPLFRACRLFLAPLPEGGGIKIKVLEALARGVPVVTTPVGAEGILETDPDAAVVVSGETDFARAVVELAGNQTRARDLARAGRRLMEEEFGWEAIAERLTALYAGPQISD